MKKICSALGVFLCSAFVINATAHARNVTSHADLRVACGGDEHKPTKEQSLPTSSSNDDGKKKTKKRHS